MVPPCRRTAPGPGLDGSLVLEISCIRLLLHSQTFAEPLLCVMLKELCPKLGANKTDFKKMNKMQNLVPRSSEWSEVPDKYILSRLGEWQLWYGCSLHKATGEGGVGWAPARAKWLGRDHWAGPGSICRSALFFRRFPVRRTELYHHSVTTDWVPMIFLAHQLDEILDQPVKPTTGLLEGDKVPLSTGDKIEVRKSISCRQGIYS